MARRTRAKDLRRTRETKRERRTVLVLCEGVASEPDYIKALKALPQVKSNTSITIDIAEEQGVPLTLVECAIDYLRDDDIDEVWCVFDVEWPKQHPNLLRAIGSAKDNRIRLAVSNPCFELWLLLHHEDRTAYLDTKTAESRSRSLEGRKGKRIDAASYMPLREAAAKRARLLEWRHRDSESPCPNDNPSSGMYMFLESIGAIEPEP